MENNDLCILCNKKTRKFNAKMQIIVQGESAAIATMEREFEWDEWYGIKVCHECFLEIKAYKKDVLGKNERYKSITDSERYSDLEFVLMYAIENEGYGLEPSEQRVGNKMEKFFCEWQKECENKYGSKAKTVDIAIKNEKAELYIEVDGEYHYTNKNQVRSDLWRDYFSDEKGYLTLHVPNAAFNNPVFFHTVVDAIKGIAKKRTERPNSI